MAYETEDHETQYCFPAVNSSCIKTIRSKHEYNIMYVFFSLLSVWTVFLNLLVIISISHFKKLHTPTNLLILSLAVSDMCVGLIVIPIEAIKLIETCWYFGDTFCGLFLIILGLFLSASLNNLMFIALDRYVAIIFPLMYMQKITVTKTIVGIFLSWFCSSVYTAIIVVVNGYFNMDRLHATGVCYGDCTLTFEFNWSVADFFITILFPCILIITLYLRIFYVAHQQVKVINSLVKSKNYLTDGSVRRKSEHKAALTLGIIVLLHLLCYLPVYIFTFTKNEKVAAPASQFLSWTIYTNSGVNPLVYAFFYPWFRKAVKHILTLKILYPVSALIDISAYNS